MAEGSVIHRVIRVRGRVQGVNYRASARRRAAELGLVARPENLADGSVRIHVRGAPAAVDTFIAWCHDGPPAARVASVDIASDSGTASGTAS